jgi:hypothetical protein
MEKGAIYRLNTACSTISMRFRPEIRDLSAKNQKIHQIARVLPDYERQLSHFVLPGLKSQASGYGSSEQAVDII